MKEAMKKIVWSIAMILKDLAKLAGMWFLAAEKMSDVLMYDMNLSEGWVTAILVVVVTLYGHYRVDGIFKQVDQIKSVFKEEKK